MNDPTPKSFVAGDTVEWSYSSNEYSADDGYACVYQFVAPGQNKIVNGAPQTDGSWLFTIDAATSETWKPEAYGWQRYVSLLGDRHTTGAGWTYVHANYANQPTGSDPRSYWQRVVDAIKATMEGRATADMNQYTFAGRSLTKMTPKELKEYLGYAETQLNAYLFKTGQGGYSRKTRSVL